MRPTKMSVVSAPVPHTGRDGRLPSLLTVNAANMTDFEVRAALDAADLPEWTSAASQVNLSLSKKGRWRAVESLKADIEDGLYNDENYSMFVIERFWLNRQSNCEEITANKGVVKTNYGHSFLFNAETLLPKKTRKVKRKNKGKNESQSGDSPKSEDPSPAPELRIEIVRPYERWVPGPSVTSRRRRERQERKKGSVHSSRVKRLNVQSTSDWAVNEDWGDGGNDWSVVPNDGATKPKHFFTNLSPVHKRKTVPTLDMDFDLDLEFDSLEEESFDEEEPTVDIDQKHNWSIEDFIVKKDSVKTRLHNKCQKKRTPLLAKENIVYIDKGEFAKFAPDLKTSEADEQNSSTADVEVAVEEVNNNTRKSSEDDLIVTLDKDDVLPSALAGTFGERYTECASYPRRFLLDMTGAIREVPHWLLMPKTHIRSTRHRYRTGRGRGRGRGWHTTFNRKYFTRFQREKRHVTAAGFLLFEEEHDGRFRLAVQTDADVDVTSWESEIKSAHAWSPQSLADTVCDVLNKQDNSSRVKPFDVPKPGITFGTLKNLLDWPEADAFYPTPFPIISNRVAAILVKGDTEVAESCSICYEEIDLKSRDSRGLALTSCGHWFCNVCWRRHVTTSVENGAVKIACPEFGCKALVDEGTLASLLTLRQLQMYKSRLDDIEIQNSSSRLWCPKPGCGRIVSVRQGTSSTGCVQCDCGATFCVLCRGHPHWPADCSHLKEYETNLKRFGDDSVLSWTSDATRVVKGKKCPECLSFIEKNMGCPNMVCRCGHSFCWQCLKPWDTHTYNPECYSKSDSHGTKHLQEVYMEDLAQRPQSRSRAYQLALASRYKQQHRQRQRLSSHVSKMKQALKGLVSRHRLAEEGAFKMTVAKRETWIREVEQMRHLLDETEKREGTHLLDWALGLIHEIRHVIEYGAVLFDHHKGDLRLRNAPSLVGRLMFLVSRMETVFEDGVKQKMTMVPGKLTRNANMALKILADLQYLKPHLPAVSNRDLQEGTL